VLLILDDEIEICRMLQRTLRGGFDEVHVATRGTDAEEVLRGRPVTHMIVDLFLGSEEPLGHELVRIWRDRYPHIRHVLVFTGSSVDERPHVYEGVDAVFGKPSGLRDLIDTVLEARA
jgi:CheY-like chemotaxis protein